MMTTTTVSREIRDRWMTLTIGVDGFTGESDNSDLIVTWQATTRQLLARMIHGRQNEAEYDLLCDAEEKVLDALVDTALALAEAVEAKRDDQS